MAPSQWAMEKETRQRAEKRRAELEAAKAAALQRANLEEAAAKFDAKEKLTTRMMVRFESACGHISVRPRDSLHFCRASIRKWRREVEVGEGFTKILVLNYISSVFYSCFACFVLRIPGIHRIAPLCCARLCIPDNLGAC